MFLKLFFAKTYWQLANIHPASTVYMSRNYNGVPREAILELPLSLIRTTSIGGTCSLSLKHILLSCVYLSSVCLSIPKSIYIPKSAPFCLLLTLPSVFDLDVL